MKARDNVDYSTLDYEGFRTMLIEELVKRIPEYTDLSSTDAGIVLLELQAHGLDILSYYADKIANEVYLDTARERENIMLLAKNLGYTVNDGRPSQFNQVFEIVPQETEFIIPRGFRVTTSANDVEPSVIFETDEELSIPAGCTGLETEEGKYLYTVPITQGYTISNEIVGTSTGVKDQRFTLGTYPVIKESISLMITELNGTTEEWTRVENFLNSSPEDKHFTLHIDGANKGIITFGNGKSGKIPSVYVDGIIATYRVGGGEIGNVSAFTINSMEQKLAGMLNTFNPTTATVLGVDKEEDEIIKLKAKSQFKATWGAISVEDYAEIAKSFTEVIDANSDTGKTKFDIVVNVLPKDYFKLSPDDLANLKSSLLTVYQKRRLLGVDVYLNFAEIVEVNPDITVYLYPTAYKKDVKYLVESAMQGSFSTGDRNLGEMLHPSEIIAELMQIEGVKSVNCNIEDLPEELTKNQVLNISTFNLSLLGGI